VQTRNRRALGAVLAAVLVAAGFGSGPSAEASEGNPRLRQLLANNPGATVAGPDSIAIADGVTLSMPSTRSGAAEVDDLCAYEHLCLFEEWDFKGEKLTIDLNCKLQYLGKFKASDGTSWKDRAHSYINNQPAGTWAMMYDNYGATDVVNPDDWEFIEASKARGKGLNQGVGWMPRSNVDVVRACPEKP
jgi:hypothetical protein